VAGQESGYGTLDGIRAAEHLLHLSEAKTPVAMVGYSGGSIATDFGGELAPRYARGLDIVGQAEGGVPVDLAHNLFYINGSPSWSGIIPAVVFALGRAFGVNVFRYLSPYGVKVVRKEEGGCINNYLGRYPGLRYQTLLKPGDKDIFSIEPFVRIVNHLIMSRTGTPKWPVLIGVGKQNGQRGDGVMVAADDEALAHAYCTRKVPVIFQEYPGLDHTDAAVPFESAAQAFVNARLSGLPTVNDCATIGKGDSIAPIKRHKR
jgi:Secretory lipase